MTTTPVVDDRPRAGGDVLTPRPASGALAVAAGVTALVALVAYVVLYATMWSPVVLRGNEGWLFLYPVFLAACVPVVGLAATSLALGIVSRARHDARRGLAVTSLVASALLLVGALPALWLGPGPLVGS